LPISATETATLAVEKEQETPAPEKTPQLVLSTSVGLFYTQVKVGQTIKADDVIGRCTVDALQLSSAIVSTANGVVAEMLVQDGQLVDYGKPLLVVKPQ
ncbi:acetyl-CoA carboxylase biotin carboxyl carrier protein subunit, partial [Mesorhizobium sp. M00.F.Ca.ET.186.01.1.1]